MNFLDFWIIIFIIFSTFVGLQIKWTKYAVFIIIIIMTIYYLFAYNKLPFDFLKGYLVDKTYTDILEARWLYLLTVFGCSITSLLFVDAIFKSFRSFNSIKLTILNGFFRSLMLLTLTCFLLQNTPIKHYQAYNNSWFIGLFTTISQIGNLGSKLSPQFAKTKPVEATTKNATGEDINGSN